MRAYVVRMSKDGREKINYIYDRNKIILLVTNCRHTFVVNESAEVSQ